MPAVLAGRADRDARLIAEWRNQHREAFFTWFEATEDGVRTWIRDEYAPDHADIMFMVEDENDVPFGHLALSHFDMDGASCECGRVVRGTSGGPPGGMAAAMRTLTRWAFNTLAVQMVFVEVFEDNPRAVRLYRRVGFATTVRIPLRRTDRDAVTKWVKLEEDRADLERPDAFALRMELRNA